MAESNIWGGLDELTGSVLGAAGKVVDYVAGVYTGEKQPTGADNATKEVVANAQPEATPSAPGIVVPTNMLLLGGGVILLVILLKK